MITPPPTLIIAPTKDLIALTDTFPASVFCKCNSALKRRPNSDTSAERAYRRVASLNMVGKSADNQIRHLRPYILFPAINAACESILSRIRRN